MPTMDYAALLEAREGWRRAGSVVVFTNGCFDLLHRGHVHLLEQARALGDVLIVGINSDASVRAVKGSGRPLVSEDDRAAVLASLASVDAVAVFDTPTPAELIRALQPDVLVKGGDWPVEQIVGADEVTRRGGRVLSLPLLPGYSTTNIVERVLEVHRRLATPGVAGAGPPAGAVATAGPLAMLADSIAVKQRLLAECGPAITRAGQLLADTLLRGGKVLFFGNGGSAAEAQHIAAELVGRFSRERRALPAVALTTDASALTAVANDWGFERVFARQVEALASPGDAVVALSTSGASPNVLAAVMAARERQCAVVGVTGARGTRLSGLCDAPVVVPSAVTERVQEASLVIGHVWCEMIDARVAAAGEP